MARLVIQKRKEREAKSKLKDAKTPVVDEDVEDCKDEIHEEVDVKDDDEDLEEFEEEEFEEEEAEDLDLGNLTPEDIAELKSLLPYKEALIKIAKGEFEIERIVEEDDEDLEEEEILEEDEDLAPEEDGEEVEVDEDFDEDFEAEDGEYTGAVDDSEEVNEAWRKRLNGTK